MTERQAFVTALLKQSRVTSKVLVVAASMGGTYGAPFVLEHPQQAVVHACVWYLHMLVVRLARAKSDVEGMD